MPVMSVRSMSLQMQWQTVFRYSHLVPNIALEVLITRNVHTDTSILQPFGLDLVVLARDGRDDNIRNGKCVLQREVGWKRGHDMMRVVWVLRSRRWSFGEFDNG